MHQTIDGGYIVAGYSNSNDGDVTGNHGNYDYWIVKIDTTGNIQWQKSLGGTGYDYAYSMQQTSDGGYVVAGQSDSNDGDITGNHGGSTDYWIVKLDNTGNIQWQKSVGGTSTDLGRSIQQTSDGGYIVAGHSGSNNGDVTGNHGNFDFGIVKLSTNVGIENSLNSQSIMISPNPSNREFRISGLEKENKIEIYDISGRLISQAISKGTDYTIDLSSKESGIYFYKVIGSDNIYLGKLIKKKYFVNFVASANRVLKLKRCFSNFLS